MIFGAEIGSENVGKLAYAQIENEKCNKKYNDFVLRAIEWAAQLRSHFAFETSHFYSSSYQ